ncbi:MAG: glycosyltransferase [Candidatus Woesearchaeota archaeon]
MLDKISIVIPTYNEEKFLPFLLKSIKKEIKNYKNLKNYEIIIADNNSNDKTIEIAKKFNCIITKGGNPAEARNRGAKIAKHDLLFLDSDVVLPKYFLKNFLEKIKKENLDYATCRVEPLIKNKKNKKIESKIRFSFMLKNLGNKIFKNHVSGQCLFVKKQALNSIKGFDETLYLAEEHDLAKRLNKKRFKGFFFYDIFVFCFSRRQEKEGTYRTLIKDIYSEIYRFFKEKIKKPIYKKEYGHY